MNAEIIAIGDEITSGQTLDTNSQWLSQRLSELGVRTLYHTTVGDELSPCVEVFRQAIARANLVVATGGLGPTADDLTRQALAEATGRELQLEPQALEHVRSIFARLGRQMPPQNEIQAFFPAGSRVVPNPHGTAPGIDLETPRDGRIFCLPGVPAEMVEMWRETVAPAIVEMLGPARRVIRYRRIHCFGAGESQVESMLPDMIRRGRRPTVGITASKATVTLRIAAEGATEAECLAAIEPTETTIRQCLGKLVFGEEDDQLQDAVARLLDVRAETLATADCITSGLLSHWLSAAKTSSHVYRGGLVLTDAEPADAIAIRCRDEFHSNYGLAIGGAGAGAMDRNRRGGGDLPSPFGRGAGGEGGMSQPVTIALASPAGVQTQTLSFRFHPELRHVYLAKQALDFLRLALLK
ncbi:MAG: CinA family nicotinamide mononucleotide deamidase-related protein [Thermoguttaceae bacterium]